MKLIKGRDLVYDVDLYDVILVGTNIQWTRSGMFQEKMFRKFPQLEELDRSGGYNSLRRLGKRVTLVGEPTVSLLYINRVPVAQFPNLNYSALEQCLKTADYEFRGKRVATTVLGTSWYDGRGTRGKVLNMMRKILTHVDLYVYEFDIEDKDTYQQKINEFMENLKKVNPTTYERLSGEENEAKLWEMWEERNKFLQRQKPIELIDYPPKKPSRGKTKMNPSSFSTTTPR